MIDLYQLVITCLYDLMCNYDCNCWRLVYMLFPCLWLCNDFASLLICYVSMLLVYRHMVVLLERSPYEPSESPCCTCTSFSQPSQCVVLFFLSPLDFGYYGVTSLYCTLLCYSVPQKAQFLWEMNKMIRHDTPSNFLVH